jgi:hypothetical protein
MTEEKDIQINVFEYKDGEIGNIIFNNSDFMNKVIKKDKWDKSKGHLLIYSTIGKSPKNILFKTKIELKNYLLKNLYKMDFISINYTVIKIDYLKIIYTY